MRYRMLGRTGLEVSELGVGCAPFGMTDYISPWDAGAADAQSAITSLVQRAVALGYNYFDVAPAYGHGRSEELLGAALETVREPVYVATKVGKGVTDAHYNREAWSSEGLRASVEGSLRRLRREVIDVIQLHGGDYSAGEDRLLLEEGGVEALQRLRAEGLVRFIGLTTEASTGAAERLIKAGVFDVIQLNYSLMNAGVSDFEKGRGLLRLAHAQGMGIAIMRPLTGGVFERLMHTAFPELDPGALARLQLNYVLSDPYVDCALVGTRSIAQLESNNTLSDDVASRLDLGDLFQFFMPQRKGDGGR